MIESLLKKKVIVCVGSGGVGKTTLSASLAVRAAQRGLRVLVMTIDPSKRLKTALGLGDDPSETIKVPKQSYQGEIHASILDAEKIFEKFVTSSADNEELASALLKNRLFKQLSTTLSGSQEFTSLLQLTKMTESDQYDLVILDTPPAQHAIDFLEAPQKLNTLFHDSVIRWFLGHEEQVGLIRKIIAKGTLQVLKALERVTGSVFMHELHDFFKNVRGIQEKIRKKTEGVRTLLKHKDTCFVLVTGFDEAKLMEATQLKDYLAANEYDMQGIVINRAHPQWYPIKEDIESLAVSRELKDEFASWNNFLENREKYFDNFINKSALGNRIIKLPELEFDLTGIHSLEVLGNEFV